MPSHFVAGDIGNWWNLFILINTLQDSLPCNFRLIKINQVKQNLAETVGEQKPGT